jgi:hypothetical protein
MLRGLTGKEFSVCRQRSLHGMVPRGLSMSDSMEEGTQPNKCKEPNSANDMNEPRRGFFSGISR